MFCNNCGTRLEDNSKFCHDCGTKNFEIAVKRQISTSSTANQAHRMTREEYMEGVDIKSVEEARSYLKSIKILFWVVFISAIVVSAMSESALIGIFWLMHIALLIYFTYYCYKILKKERLPGFNAAFCFIFAPLSWFSLYPTITTPLKIIIGEKAPPRNYPITPEEREIKQKVANKSFWRMIKILVSASFGVIIVLCLLLFFIYR